MSAFSTSIAPSGSYRPNDTCAICCITLDTALSYRVGDPVIHSGPNGAQHPIHKECFKTAIAASAVSGIGKCPICRDPIPLAAFASQPKKPLTGKKIAIIGAAIIAMSTAHGLLSLWTGSSLISATAPGIVSTLLAAKNLYLEHKELGLVHSLRTNILQDLKSAVITIGVPAVSSIVANRITESIIPNSLITVTLAVGGIFSSLWAAGEI